MGKPKFDPPTATFPYRISKRLNVMSVPRKYIIDTGEGMPAYTPRGIRKSALNGAVSDRVNEAAYPYLWRLVLLKRLYKNKFSPEKLAHIDHLIELSNATCYSKIANCVIDLKKQDAKDVKKKKGWSESEWKKHTDYINLIAKPKTDFQPPPVDRGECKPLEDIMKRIDQICFFPDFKIYKRLSQEDWYRDPVKVSRNALKYAISPRVKKLAEPKKIPVED